MSAALRCWTEEELSESVESSTLPAHVATCPSCRARREALARAPALLRTQWAVAELSDPALARTGAALMAAVAREGAPAQGAAPQRAPWIAAAAAALLLIAGASAWWATTAPEGARAPSSAVHAASEHTPATARRARVVASSAGARLEHSLTQLDPAPGAPTTAAALEEEVIRLRDGRVRLEVAPLSPVQRFRVVAGDGEVEVRGTVFEVRVAADRLTAVQVDEGVVVVRVGAEPAVWLRAGERWARAPEPAAERAAPPATRRARPRPPSLAAAPTTTDDDDDDDRAAPSATAAPAALPDAGAAASGPTAPAPVTPPDAGTTAAPPDAAATAPLASSAPAAVDVPAAHQHFRSGWGHLRAHAPATAARAFATAERLAGADPLAADAGYWRAAALVQAESAHAEAALRSFLARYPLEPRTAAVSLMLADVLIATDRRREARTLLLDIAATADPARAAEARARLSDLPR